MNARSALFDVYGDHLRPRSGAAPVASLVALLAPLGIAAPAVRTAVSRMVRQGWLQPVGLESGPGYALTARAEHRLADAADRIYRSKVEAWDGRWHLVVLGKVTDRASRERLRSAMSYLGYASLREETWISPRGSDELDGLLASESVGAERFYARSEQPQEDAALAARAWDLDALGRAYADWLETAKVLVAPQTLGDDSCGGTEGAVSETGSDPGDYPCSETDPGIFGTGSDQRAFVVRTRLVHEWRKFLFRDPGLPRALLPPGWAGDDAARFFDAEASRLLPAASRYVDACLI